MVAFHQKYFEDVKEEEEEEEEEEEVEVEEEEEEDVVSVKGGMTGGDILLNK